MNLNKLFLRLIAVFGMTMMFAVSGNGACTGTNTGTWTTSSGLYSKMNQTVQSDAADYYTITVSTTETLQFKVVNDDSTQNLTATLYSDATCTTSVWSATATDGNTISTNRNVTAGTTYTIRIVGSSSSYNTDYDFYGIKNPEINVRGNGTSIGDGDSTPRTSDNTDFGDISIYGETIDKTFTIENTGANALTIGTVSVTGDFSVITQPAASVAGGGSTTFTIRFSTTTTGLKTGTVSFSNNDSNENPYDFSIQGTGQKLHPFYRINPDNTKNIRGNYMIAGNTVMCITDKWDDADHDGVKDWGEDYEGYGGNCIDSGGELLTSNDRVSKYIDIDGDGSTWNSTSSYITLPDTYDNSPSRGVLWAGLFWQGRISTDTNHVLRYGVESGGSYTFVETGDGSGYGTLDMATTGANTIKLKVDSGTYSDATADTFFEYDSSNGITYAAYSDVTSILQASNLNDGKHVFTVANLTTNEGRENSPGVFGGWSLVVIYAEDAKGKTRNISVYNGFDAVDDPSPAFTITDFKLPTKDLVHATLSLFSGEGEYLYGSDTGEEDWIKISNDGIHYEYMPDAAHDSNIFDAVFSDISRDEVAGFSNNLQVNNDGVDVDNFDVSALMTNYRDVDPDLHTLYLQWSSNQDYITPSMLTFATELYAPKLCYDYSFKQDGQYLKADNDGAQLPLMTGTINNSQIDVSVYIRNIEADIDAANISFYTTDVNSTLFDYANNSIASSNVNGSILIPRDDSGEGCGYHDVATTPIGCVSGSNVRIGLGKDVTGYSINGAGNFGSADFGYVKFGLAPKFSGMKDVNESLGLSVDYTIRPDGVAADIEYNYVLGVNMEMCPASAGYTPTWGTFNVIDRYAVTIGELPANNLRTQVSRKGFDVDVAAYGKAADNTYSIKPIADINTTVLVEMIDNDAFHDANASCANPDSNVSQAIYVPLTITAGAGGDMTDPVPTQLLPYYNFAVKNASFRIWYFNDKDDLLIQNWTATTSDPIYKLNLQSITGLYKSDTHTLCVSDCGNPTSKDCFDCIRANYAKPLCSRDNFAVRPESYDLRIYDVNQTLAQTDPLKNTTKIDLSTQYQYTPQFGASIGRINIAAGYNYRFDMNATGNDINLAKVPGYTRYFNGANTDYNATMIWEPEVGHVTTGCNDTSGKSLSFYVANGQMTNNEQNQTQVGEYRLNIIDSGWSAVDWKSSLLNHHAVSGSGFVAGEDCVLGTETTVTDVNGKIGCITSSAHSGGGYTYKDHDLRLKPAKFDVSGIAYGVGKTPLAIGTGGSGFVYNSNLGVNSDMTMSLKAFGAIKAVGYGGETLSNFVKECYATDLNLSISHDANTSLPFIGRMSVAETNGTQIFDSLKFSAQNNAVQTIEDTYFGKAGNGQSVPTIRLNFDRNATTPVEPQIVHYGDLNVSCLSPSDCNMSAAFNTTPNTAVGSDAMDFNVTHAYGRVVARKVNVMGLIAFNALAQYEVYKNNNLLGTPLAADQFDSDWFVNTLHTDANYGDANVTVIDPVGGSNLPTHSVSANGVETYVFNPFTIRQGYKAHVDTEGWLWYGGINALAYVDPNGPAQAGADNLSCLTHPCFDISMGRIIGNTGSAKTESEAQKGNKKTTSTGWSTSSEYAPAAR